MKELQTFIRRMTKLGYKLNLTFNYPWIYLNTINGKEVFEKQFSDHNWTIALYPLNGDTIQFIYLPETIKLIRKYGKEQHVT